MDSASTSSFPQNRTGERSSTGAGDKITMDENEYESAIPGPIHGLHPATTADRNSNPNPGPVPWNWGYSYDYPDIPIPGQIDNMR